MIQVIHRAIDILEYVAKEREKPKLLGQIASDLDLNPATCANIIKTLVIRGYLQKAELQKGYLLGNQIYSITDRIADYQDLLDIADEELNTITQELNENSLIAILKGDNRKVILKKYSNQQVQAHTPEEKKAYDSSTGRMLIAMMEDEEVEKFIHRFGLPASTIWPHASTKKSFFEQIKIIRTNGYALIEDSVQVIGIATPLYKNQKLIASLSVYMPAFRFTNTIRQKMITISTNVAKNISTKLG